MNRLLDEIMANPEPGHDAISNKLQRLGLPTQTAGHSYEQMNTLKKTAAHDAGLGTIVGAAGGGLAGDWVARKFKASSATRVLGAVAGAIAGGGLGYLADKPLDTPSGLSVSDRLAAPLALAALGGAGAYLGGKGAELFGGSENENYVTAGRILGGGTGLVAGLLLANQALDKGRIEDNTPGAWRRWLMSPESRRRSTIEGAAEDAAHMGNTFRGQFMKSVVDHPVINIAGGAGGVSMIAARGPVSRLGEELGESLKTGRGYVQKAMSGISRFVPQSVVDAAGRSSGRVKQLLSSLAKKMPAPKYKPNISIPKMTSRNKSTLLGIITLLATAGYDALNASRNS